MRTYQVHFALLFALIFALLTQDVGAESPLANAHSYLKQHCYACHGSLQQEGDYRFDTLSTDLSQRETLETCYWAAAALRGGVVAPCI